MFLFLGVMDLFRNRYRDFVCISSSLAEIFSFNCSFQVNDWFHLEKRVNQESFSEDGFGGHSTYFWFERT